MKTIFNNIESPGLNKELERLSLIADRKKLTNELNDLLEWHRNRKYKMPYFRARDCYSYIKFTGEKNIGVTCKYRWCYYCELIKKVKYYNSTFPLVEKWKKPCHVILTIENCDTDSLVEVIDFLEDRFSKIAKFFRNNEKQYSAKFQCIRKLEIGFNGRLYHPHLHILVNDIQFAKEIIKKWQETKYIDKGKIESKAQELREVCFNELNKVLFYILKSPIKLEDFIPEFIDNLDSVYYLTQRRHFIRIYGFKLSKVSQPKIKQEVLEEFYWDNKLNNWVSISNNECLMK